MSYDIAGRKVLITGASSGIGAAAARAFAGAGATVGICARREDRLASVLADCRSTAPESRMWVVDLADLDGVAGFARRADDELGGIDVLVNNAGIPKRRHVLDLTPDVVQQVMAVNFFSPVILTTEILPRMLERGSGRIVNVSSVAARLSPPREAAYSASKAALTAWAESMSVDLTDTDVKVHLVYPGVVDTELFHLPDNEASLTDLDPERPEDLAAAMIRQVVDGGLDLYFPEWFADIASGKAANNEVFLRGSAEWVKQRTESA